MRSHDPIHFSPQRKLGGGWVCWKDSHSPPASPDYVGAANATAAGNLQAAQAATRANRVNQYSPYGSITYSQGGTPGGAGSTPTAPASTALTYQGQNFASGQDLYSALANDYQKQTGNQPPPDMVSQINSIVSGAAGPTAAGSDYSPNSPSNPSGQWSQNITLSDTGKKLLDAMNQSQLGTAGLEKTATDRVAQTYAQPFGLGGAQDATNQAYGNLKSRLDPQWAHNSEMQDSQLANQGITRGSAAYDDSMRVFNNAKNDAYTQANTTAMNFAPQTYQMDVAARNQPLNELNAIRTGSQVTNPQFGQVPQQGQTAGPNLSGAAAAQGQYDQGLYNASVGQQNSQMGGLFGLGGAALMSPAGTFAAFSDRRLKSNIVRIGTHPLGVGIYEYDIFGCREIGVMADEVLRVMPQAVSTHASGYRMVDYGRLACQP